MVFLLLVCSFLLGVAAQKSPNCANGRGGGTMVHLFEWRWQDIAAECERFLGPKGFCGVQTSPPNEHRIVTGPFRPWWERYQPVSYKLDSRSGPRAEFIDMVDRCNAVGVRVYIDAVVNHMVGADGGSGTGSGGSHFDTSAKSFPGVPFGPNDFTPRSLCGNANGNINSDYGDPNKVRHCALVSLMDLYGGSDYVRQKIADYFNDVIDIGVDGFRIDAAKHMWPGDLQGTLDKVSNSKHGGRPFVFMEVIDLGGEAISAGEYTGMGRVTEFRYGIKLSEQMRGAQLKNLRQFGSSWGMLGDGDAFVFVDNHDNQRGHGGAGAVLTSHEDSRHYKMAVEFMLSWPYGSPRLMSSYSFSNTDQGPPSDGSGRTNSVPITADSTCGGGWVCEHRWRQIANMVEWRNQAGNSPVSDWWSNGNNQIAFSRGGKAFIAFNKDDGQMSETLSTGGMSAGTYCDIISGNLVNGACTGVSVNVDGSGRAQININGAGRDPVVAIHAGSRMGSGGNTGGDSGSGGGSNTPVATVQPPTSTGYQRTVVFLKKSTSNGQDLFLRGGTAVQKNGLIPIQYSYPRSGSHFAKYTAWQVGDSQLDWNGAQTGQGQYQGTAASGSPMFWSTNSQSSSGHVPENTFGDHYWMWEVDMDCSSTDGGWFAFKGIISDGSWESDISQSVCGGTVGGTAPANSRNHVARCGALNVFSWGSGSCTISEL